MPKATIQQLIDAGFTSQQFGSPADFTTATTGYLARVLLVASAWVSERLGAGIYAALVTTTDNAYVFAVQAEQYRAIAELWRRRAAFFDSAGRAGMQDTEYSERREYLAHAAEAQAMADAYLADAQSALALTPDIPGVGLSMLHVEHGAFPQVTA